MQPKVVRFFMKLGQSKPIYDAMIAMRDGDEFEQLDSAQQRIIHKAITSMTHRGIGLEAEPQKRFNEIQTTLAELGTNFSNNVLDSTKHFELILQSPEEVEGLPQSLKQATAQAAQTNGHPNATPESGPWRITLDAPIIVPFLQNSRRRDLREKLYRAQIQRASTGDWNNQANIDKILQLRQEAANLLGFQTYAELSLASKMADSVTEVDQLSEELRTASFGAAKTELKDLTDFARTESKDPNLELRHWDISFWSERYRENQYAYNDEDLRPYFQLPKVLNGLFALATKLFGVSFEESGPEIPVWNACVKHYRVLNESGEEIAAFYTDLYSRPENKRGGAWMDELWGRKKNIQGAIRNPVAYLVCNQTPPVGDKPSLMTFRELETLFHEFGHTLQHMLTTVDYPQASGIENVEWDAVELPSQFMENWCYHKDTLLQLTTHIETGEVLPDPLFDKIYAAKNHMSGTATLRQLYFGQLDMELHHRFVQSADESVATVKQRVAAKATVLPPLPEDRFLCAFSHIFAGGYAAGYYSYKWAEVLSADAFGAFEDVGLDNASAVIETGRRFRNTVLSLGGSDAPLEIFKSFRGRAPSTEALLRHLGLS